MDRISWPRAEARALRAPEPIRSCVSCLGLPVPDGPCGCRREPPSRSGWPLPGGHGQVLLGRGQRGPRARYADAGDTGVTGGGRRRGGPLRRLELAPGGPDRRFGVMSRFVDCVIWSW